MVAKVCIDQVVGRNSGSSDDNADGLDLSPLSKLWGASKSPTQWQPVQASAARLSNLFDSDSATSSKFRLAGASAELAALVLAKLRSFPTDLDQDAAILRDVDQCEVLREQADASVLGGILAGGEAGAAALHLPECPSSIEGARNAIRFRMGRKVHLVRLLRSALTTTMGTIGNGASVDERAHLSRLPGDSAVRRALTLKSSTLQ